MTSRPRRVPPPPPPGFGDEEYYKLYGEPEEYQKYRQVHLDFVHDVTDSVQEGPGDKAAEERQWLPAPARGVLRVQEV